MRKTVFAALAMVAFGGAVVAPPAQARCVQNGAVTICRGAPQASVVILQQFAPAGRQAPGVVYQLTYPR